MDADPGRWSATLTSLVAAGADVVLLAGSYVEPAKAVYSHLNIEISADPLDTAVHNTMGGAWAGLFVATAPVAVPPNAFDRAVRFLADDMRIATVSFLSNDANYLSYPNRNQPTGLAVDGHNEATVTALLRANPHLDEMVPIPVPAGGGIFMSTLVIRSIGGIDSQCPSFAVGVVDFALRAVRRGFRNVLDPSTFIMRPLERERREDPLADEPARGFLAYRYPFFPALHARTSDSRTEPLADALAVAAATVRGLRVLIDGSCLGPYEMGTQVSLLSLVSALCESPRIRQIVIGLQDLQAPAYARAVLSHPKIALCQWLGGRFSDAPTVDILHRPFQPDSQIPWDDWRRLAHRLVVTLQDLIAYDNGDYHHSVESWLAYRDAIREGVRQSDAVVVISHDSGRSVEHSHLPIAGNSLYVVELGADHPTGGWTQETPPMEIVERDLVTSDFVLVLGASYAHKNRDLAIEAWQELRRRGHRTELILGGVVVPFGSTRNDEAIRASRGEWPITLADLSSSERNWLMRHARLVLYPSSAEGFGLIPFEAAEFDTPTVFVGFGPLGDMFPSVPVAATDWGSTALADAMEQILVDPDVARRQIDAISKSAASYTWENSADALIDTYMRVLAAPSQRV